MPRSKTDKIRKQASKKLANLLKEQRHKCFYCKMPIVEIKSISLKKRIEVKKLTIVFKSGNKVRESLFATVDHVRKIEHGGKNEKNNLVASCLKCNNARDKEYFAVNNSLCKCGKPKKRKTKSCEDCWLRNHRTFLVSYIRENRNDYY